MSTAYHAKYFAFELTKRCAFGSMEKLAASLADAQVDLNPHQVEAALFAFRSPLSKGAILADEVGLTEQAPTRDTMTYGNMTVSTQLTKFPLAPTTSLPSR